MATIDLVGLSNTAVPMVTAARRSLPVAALLVTACGAHERLATPPLDVGSSHAAVVKVRRAHDDYLLLLETPTSIAVVERPDRVLRRFPPNGPPLDYRAPDGAVLVDVAAHPGGEASILLASDAGYALERWLPDGSRGGAVVIDGIAPTPWSRDAGRVAAVGDDVVVAVRVDDSSVRADRYTPDGAGYRRLWDTLVEPANDQLPAGLISGSFDPFGQLRAPFRAYVDAGADGAVWVAVQVDPGTDLLSAHDTAFGDELQFVVGPQPSADMLVTRLDGGGRRMFSRIVGTASRDQLYGMRAVAGGVLVVGRSETHPGDPGGWDGLVAGATDDGAVTARTVDAGAGDILFDADLLSDGRTVAVGGTGYTDNPSGGSISETCSLLALVLTDDAQIDLPLPGLPRHNHLRTLLVTGASLWVAGMSDGPGTHSGDGDPSAIRAEPFVAALAIP